MIIINYPDYNCGNYRWLKEDNVTLLGRADEFEEQNLRFIDAGYTTENSFYYRAFDIEGGIHVFCRTIFPGYSVGIMTQPLGQTLPLHGGTFF